MKKIAMFAALILVAQIALAAQDQYGNQRSDVYRSTRTPHSLNFVPITTSAGGWTRAIYISHVEVTSPTANGRLDIYNSSSSVYAITASTGEIVNGTQARTHWVKQVFSSGAVINKIGNFEAAIKWDYVMPPRIP